MSAHHHHRFYFVPHIQAGLKTMGASSLDVLMLLMHGVIICSRMLYDQGNSAVLFSFPPSRYKQHKSLSLMESCKKVLQAFNSCSKLLTAVQSCRDLFEAADSCIETNQPEIGRCSKMLSAVQSCEHLNHVVENCAMFFLPPVEKTNHPV